MDPVTPNHDRPAFLIVDDNDDNRVTLAMRLDILGYDNVIMAANGREALERLRANRIDIIFLDIMMPDISGLEVLRYMRREPDLAKIPVIVVSAKSMPGDIKIGLEAGASMYLTKPVGFQDLKQAVEKVLSADHTA